MGNDIAKEKSIENNNNLYLLYAIGLNEYGEFGVNHNRSLTQLTCFSVQQYQNQHIYHIYNGYGYTIYCDKNHQQIWSSGFNKYGQFGNSLFTSSKQRKPITFFIQNNIKINKICCNITNDCTFWITDKNKLYGNGCNYHNNLGDDTSINKSTPFLIENISNVQNVKSSAKYSIAICKTYPNIDQIIANSSRATLSSKACKINQKIKDLIDSFYRKNIIFSTINMDENGINNQGIKGWKQLNIFNDKNIIKIETGRDHTLFLEKNGVLWSYGFNNKGQLGINDKNIKICNKLNKINYFIENDIKIMDISCGSDHNLAIDENGKIYSWGSNDFGQCGDGTFNDIFKPKLIKYLDQHEIIEIKCGLYHSFAKCADEEHYLFGSNKYNECLTFKHNTEEINVCMPHCIDDIVKQKTDGKTIKNIFLGCQTTYFIMDEPQQIV